MQGKDILYIQKSVPRRVHYYVSYNYENMSVPHSFWRTMDFTILLLVFYSLSKPQDVPQYVTNALKFMDLLKGQEGLEIEDTIIENIPNVLIELKA